MRNAFNVDVLKCDTFVSLATDADLPFSPKQLFLASSMRTSVVSTKTTMTNLTGCDIVVIHVLVAQDQVEITHQETVFNSLFNYLLNYEPP